MHIPGMSQILMNMEPIVKMAREFPKMLAYLERITAAVERLVELQKQENQSNWMQK